MATACDKFMASEGDAVGAFPFVEEQAVFVWKVLESPMTGRAEAASKGERKDSDGIIVSTFRVSRRKGESRIEL